MKAFVGHSFDRKDEDLVNKIMNFLSNKVGIHCEDAEKGESKDISEKIKEKIDRNEIFVGIFTNDREIKQPIQIQEVRSRNLIQKLKNLATPKSPQPVLPPIFTTSNWVIQESGYAIGKSKQIILLVEKGIDKFPELQGDIEVIFFDRTSLDAPLLKLYEIVDSIKFKTKTVEPTISPEILSKEEPKGNVGEQEELKTLPWREMLDAQKKGEIVTVANIYKEKIRSHLKLENAILWDAVLFRWQYCSGDANALVGLTKLAEETKKYDVNKQLAFCYDFTDDNEDARKLFKKCIELTNESSEKVDCLIDIAISYAKEEYYNTAIDQLLDAANDPEFKTHLEKIFSKLVEIAKMKKDDYLYVIFAEKALNINAVNLTLRFNLGLKYLNADKNDLAVYHYKKYLSIQENSGGFNNMAIAFADLNMKTKEADCLEKAVEKRDDTLPYANIAQKYLDEGFANVADRLLRDAEELGREKVEVHERVGIVRGKLKKMLEDEEKKEEEILLLAAKIQKFNIRHADAYYLKNEGINFSEFSGIWRTEKWGELDFKFIIVGKTFEVDSQERIELTPGFFGSGILAALGTSQPLAKEYKIKKIQIKGNINNLAGNYTIKVTEEKEKSSLTGLVPSLLTMPSPDEIYSANGIFIINNATTIDVLEEDNKNNRFFSHWNKK